MILNEELRRRALYRWQFIKRNKKLFQGVKKKRTTVP
jgi:tetrahydromethanopterin S-methyltransferase subunit F